MEVICYFIVSEKMGHSPQITVFPLKVRTGIQEL